MKARIVSIEELRRDRGGDPLGEALDLRRRIDEVISALLAEIPRHERLKLCEA